VASQITKRAGREPAGDSIHRAADRVSLACRALSEATTELRVAHRQSGMTLADDAADQVSVETERVCELAGELQKLATNLATRRPLSAVPRSA
jgi:capsule polysaccharide export protein KpsE/RkpR